MSKKIIKKPQKDSHESDSEGQEEIVVKNLDSGESKVMNSSDLKNEFAMINSNKSKTAWNQYFKTLASLDQKLLALVVRRNFEELKKVLTEYPVQLSKYKFMDGWTLLHYAVSQSDPTITRLLLKHGIDPNIQTENMRRTPLHEAVLSNKLEIVSILIKESDTNPNLQDIDGNTAMHFAVDYSYEHILHLILQSAIHVNLVIKNNLKMSALDYCREMKLYEQLVQYLKPEDMVTMQTDNSEMLTTSTYQSRMIERNSDIIPRKTRVDQIQKFLSLRQNAEKPTIHFKTHNNHNNSIYQIQELQDSDEELHHSSNLLKSSIVKKYQKMSVVREKKLVKAQRMASQNIGLLRQSIFKSHLESEQTIESYDKLRKLGQGAFAEVFLIRKKHSSKLLAMKRLNKKYISERNLLRYVMTQKMVLTEINHPFVLQAEACLQDLKYLYILMELCEGGDLQKIVRRQRISEEVMKTYACQIALATDSLHSKGILNRDLKVSNILLDKLGHAKLADFGLAKQAEISYSFLGSISYLAPEMLVEGQLKKHGKSLDWYLYGIFLYEMLVGHPPFYDEDHQTMKFHILNSMPVFPINTPLHIKDLILKLLEKNPQKRLQNLEQIKSHEWFNDVNWSNIFTKKAKVIELPEIDYKELRKKQLQDQQKQVEIQNNIEWFQNWNYKRI